MANANTRLFKPVKLGNAQLEHRVVLAPLTRFRAPQHVPVDRHATYYAQRASKGGLLITEATFISEEAGGLSRHVPGIYTQEQIQGWKKVTDAVHKEGGLIYMQGWTLGRANPGSEDVKKVVSASDIPFEGGATPEPMSIDDIKRYLESWKQAALNAVEAGFDGVEIHSANGYLLQQFLDEGSNKRTDQYGGSEENRTRFTKEVIDTVVAAIGQEKTGIRFSPYGTFQGMVPTENTVSTYVNLMEYIHSKYPKFAYVHFVEDVDVWRGIMDKKENPKSNDPFRSVLRKPVEGQTASTDVASGLVYPEPTEDNPTLFISCGDFKNETSVPWCEAKGDLIAIGRNFISNPDLPERIKNNQKWTGYDRSTFYTPLSDEGYIDYAVYGERGHGEIVAEKKEKEEAQKKANM